jgi:hypothetical protein
VWCGEDDLRKYSEQDGVGFCRVSYAWDRSIDGVSAVFFVSGLPDGFEVFRYHAVGS